MVSLQAVFHSPPPPNDTNKYAATTAAHSKHIMELLKNKKVLMTKKIIYGRINMDVMSNTDAQLYYIYYKCFLMHITL